MGEAFGREEVSICDAEGSCDGDERNGNGNGGERGK